MGAVVSLSCRSFCSFEKGTEDSVAHYNSLSNKKEAKLGNAT